MHPDALDSRLGAVCVNLQPVVRLVPGEPLCDVLERIERQDPGAAAAWRRKYGKPVSWLPERDAGAVSIEIARAVNARADALAPRR
ncbi:hypothetical protein [Candidatus Palauibacter sp.]|uniref:hypothetical protein n=1 Tax=Candidatus Palauibacter sp. TaxID=3101350 RepID=UPI003AF2148D